MNNNNAAILLFSRTATAEAAAKPLAFGKRSAQSVASFMVNHAKKIAAQSQLPVFFFSEKQQCGDTFGERFANAFENIFSLGYKSVISIGNDCLNISTKDILSASKALEKNPSVLGETTDGGAYLIGLQAGAFQKNAFQNIHWQTNSAFEELVQFIDNQNFKTLFLVQKSDIDFVSDWRKILPIVSKNIQKTLLQLFEIGIPKLLVYAFLPINHCFLKASICLRAPPFPY